MDDEVFPLVPDKKTEGLCTNVKKLIRNEMRTVAKDPTVCKANTDLEKSEPSMSKVENIMKIDTLSCCSFYSKSIAQPHVAGHCLEKDGSIYFETQRVIGPEDMLPKSDLPTRPQLPLWAVRLAGLNKQKRTSSPIVCKKSKRLEKKTSPLPHCDSIARILPGTEFQFNLPSIQCLPSKVIFFNYEVGKEYTKIVRLLNVSKHHLQFTVVPPWNVPVFLKLEGRLNGGITTGRYAKLTIKYIPKNVRPLKTEVLVKDAEGGVQPIMIWCALESLQLHMLPTNMRMIELPTLCECNDKQATVIHMGSCLLGNMIRFDFTFHCVSKQCAFFILSEDEWEENTLKDKVTGGYKISKPFIIYPVFFSGGGKVDATIWFIPSCCDIVESYAHNYIFLSSNVIARKITVTAEVVSFDPEKIYLLNHPKDYDIDSDSDERCEYYIDLGVAFHRRPLAKVFTVQNDSLVNYKCTWQLCPWNEDMEDDCYNQVRMVPPELVLVANSVTNFQITVDDVGDFNEEFRCVAMLVLKQISLSSLPLNYNCIRVPNTERLNEFPVLPAYEQCHCPIFSDIIQTRVEVGWRVENVHVIVEPSTLVLSRINVLTGYLSLTTRVTNCASEGNESIECQWQSPALVIDSLSPETFSLASTEVKLDVLTINLAKLKAIDEIVLKVNGGEFVASIKVQVPDRMEENLKLHRTQYYYDIVRGGEKKDFPFTVTNKLTSILPFKLKSYIETYRENYTVDNEIERVQHPKYADLFYKEKRLLFLEMEATKKPALKVNILQLCDGDDKRVKMQALIFALRCSVPMIGLTVPLRRKKIRYENVDDKPDDNEVKFDDGVVSKERALIVRCTRPLIVGKTYLLGVALTNFSAIHCGYAWDEEQFNDKGILSVTFTPEQGTIAAYESLKILVELKALGSWKRRISLRECKVEYKNIPLYLLFETEALFELPKKLPCLM